MEVFCKKRKAFQNGVRIKKPGNNNKYIWFLGRAMPVKDTKGKVIKWCGTCTNINEQKKNAQKKDEFLSIASHELKTPLTSLKAYVQLLERDLKNPQENDIELYVKKVIQNISRLDNLINELLNVSKIQAGKLSLNTTEFCFEELVLNHVEEIRHNYPSHKLITEGNAKINIKADKEKLEQVISNYISNAVKYSPNSNEVIITFLEDENNVLLAVKDFGIGIPSDLINNLFDRFYQVATSNFNGLGLGLYIASQIIKKHEGKTWVKSEINIGSTFYFCIPKGC